ncbi:MAG: YgiT-type zinc finger protein [Nitrospirae bacterium]|nr:MAG: YgiT-type zinc finger protein [Nitrospirota bacterium]
MQVRPSVKITTCPTCGSRKIKRVRRTWTGEYRGLTYKVPALEYHECPACGEKVYDRKAMKRIEAHSPAFPKAHKVAKVPG